MTTLTMLVWKGYDDEEASHRFRESHDVRVMPIYVDDDEAIRAELERGGETIDLAVPDNRYVDVLAAAGLVQPLDYGRVPNMRSCFDRFLALARPRREGGSWSAPYLWGSHPIAYNANFVAEPPSSWLDVLKPEFHGKVVMLDQPRNQITLWAGVLGTADPTRLTPEELDRVIDLLVDLKRRTAAIMATWAEIPAVLASGRAWVATAGWEAIVHYARQTGADVRVAHPREGDPAWMDCWCIASKAPNQAIAYLWIDWMIGVEAQRVLCRNLPCGTVNQEAVESLDRETRELLPYERIEELFADPASFGMPPVEPVAGITTLTDWMEAWERVRAA
jgi:spermidine/putrescine transport system substrate-binding protein